MKEHFNCPVQAAANTISGKWKVLLLWHLSFGPHRFSELRDAIANVSEGVTDKVLTAQLRELERDKIVTRVVTHTVPLRVDYMLSEPGKRMVPIMEAMYAWGTKHLGIPPNMPRPATR